MKQSVAFMLAASATLLPITRAIVPVGRAPEDVEVTITAKPVRDGGTEVAAVAIREDIRGPINQAKPFALRIAITYTGRTGIADRVDSLVVRDPSGVVPLVIENDPVNPAGYNFFRHWRAERRVTSPIAVTYRMRPNARITGGPQFEHFATGGGITSGGMQLFLLPENVERATLRVKWDLNGVAEGSVASSTYGEGDFELKGPPDTLWGAFYLAGPAGSFIAPTSGFRAYWLGTPVYNSRREMEFAYHAYEYLKKFYRDTTTKSYRVFTRAPGGGGGTAQQNSFMGGSAAGSGDSTRPGPRNTLTHEMGHYFIGELAGRDEDTDPWYSEGLNTYYTRILLLRSGLAPVNDYLTDINSNARRYYASPYRNASNDSLHTIGYATGFGSESAQNMAYTRGSLFWSEVDARIRAASRGRHTLDDAMLPLLEQRRRGNPPTQAAVVAAIERELGPAGRQLFEAVIVRGETLDLGSGSFGPCFERKAIKIPTRGTEIDGYEWQRVSSLPDELCRER